MVNRFLRAKHWQLFLVMFGIPLLVQIMAFVVILTGLGASEATDANVFSLGFRFLAVLIVLFSGSYFGWLWSIAIGLQKYVPKTVKMKVVKFKVFFVISIAYALGMALFIGLGPTGFFMAGNISFSLTFGYWWFLSFFLYVFCTVSVFYVLYFSAKTFKTVELQREVQFGEIIGEFFLLWFYLIGLWIIQPKLNHWIAKKSDVPSS